MVRLVLKMLYWIKIYFFPLLRVREGMLFAVPGTGTS